MACLSTETSHVNKLLDELYIMAEEEEEETEEMSCDSLSELEDAESLEDMHDYNAWVSENDWSWGAFH